MRKNEETIVLMSLIRLEENIVFYTVSTKKL